MLRNTRLVALAASLLGGMLLAPACSNPKKETPPPSAPKAGAGEPSPAGAGSSKKKDYDLIVEAPAEGKVGAELKTTIRLVPVGGLHVNQEFPHKLTLDAVPAGVACSKTEFKTADAASFTEDKAEFVLSCTANEAGVKSFAGKYKLSVCTDTYCATPTEALAWSVDVKP